MEKILFTATVVKTHIAAFHLPYIDWCKRQGYTVHVAARNDCGGPCVIPGCDAYFDVPFARSPFSPQNLRAYKALKALLEQNDYDLIQCNTPVAGVLTRLAARNARKRGTKVVYMAHGFHFFRGAPLINWLLYYPVEKHFARDTDVLVTINREDYDRACRARFPAGKIVYIPGVGVDTARFQAGDRRAGRAFLRAPDGAPLVVCVGECNKNKNQALLLHALRESGAYCAVVGEGPQREALAALGAELGFGERLLLPGYCENVPDILAAADVFAFPSLREGLSAALMEAMAAGLPCVVSDIRGNRDLIAENRGGFCLPPRDTAGFARALAKLLGDPPLREAMGAYNREAVRAYGLSAVLPQMAALYESCLEASR